MAASAPASYLIRVEARPTAGNFLERTRDAKKIIVVDFGFLGDSVHLTPALWEVKRNYPAAQLHTLSATVGTEVLKLAPCVDRPWAIPLTGKSPPWWKHWGVLRALRRERFDVAFNFTGSDRSLFAMAFIGAPNGLAYTGRKHFWNRWIRADWVARSPGGLPVYEQRRQLLAAGGMSLQPARFDFEIPSAARHWAQSAVPENSVHFSINASTPEKEWPIQHWIDLAKNLLQTKPSLSLVATASSKSRERERLAELANGVNDSRLRIIESPEIAQLAAILKHCRLQIGGDSGVLHLAMALNVPTLTVFRQYSGIQDWIPVGSQHHHIIAPTLADISVEQMSKEALELGLIHAQP